MRKLPYCNYPTAADVELHGLQKLPAELPLMNLEAAKPFRSETYKAKVIDKFSNAQLLGMAKVIADSFAVNEPMVRYIQPPKNAPKDIFSLKHKDDFGDDEFGAWTKENIFYWIIRMFVLTDSFSPVDNIKMNCEIFTHSLAIQDEEEKIIGGALNHSVSHSHTEQPIRSNDPFLNAVYTWFQPIHHLVVLQDGAALNYLCERYQNFKTALGENKVGTFYMVARSSYLPAEDTFELAAATAERFEELGYKYIVTNAANQWTGAAFELLNGVRVHFAPYRAARQLKESHEGLPDEVSSKDGYLSNKDSGCMFYVLRIN
jgi:hypothetical protein